MTKKQPQNIEISPKTIIFTVLFIIGLYLLFLIKDVIMGLFVSVLFATALNPTITKLEKFKIPRPISILLVYFVLLILVVLSIGTIVPPLVEQTSILLNTLPIDAISSNIKLLEVNLENIQLLTNQLGSVTPIVRIITSTFSGLIALFTFLVITFYLLIERKNLHKYLVLVLGNETSEKKVQAIIDQIESQIGNWVRGQITLMFLVGLVTYFGLLLLKIPFALPLAILAGLLEIIPNIGPTISAIPAIFVALIATHNPLVALFVAALYILVQQVENNFFVPKIMQSAVGIHPLVTILSIIIGLQLASVAGAVLAVPIYLVSKVIFTQLILPKIRK